jgi:hypothetical protein
MTNNPFDWKSYVPTINMADVERARRSSYQQTRLVNEKRKQGIEPSKPYANSFGGVPQDYTTDMPVMPLHKRSAAKKRRAGK